MKIFLSFLLLWCISTSSSSSVSTSDGILTSVGVRNLLQEKIPCTVPFEQLNYTIITSRCKGPQYPPGPCCDALKEFACPYSDKLNDLSTKCSEDMFSYINLIGKYPDGLFATICHDDKQGLNCPALAPETEGNNTETDSSNSPGIYSSSLLRLTMRFIIFLCMWI